MTEQRSVQHFPSPSSGHKESTQQLKQKIQELESLVTTISRGKYMWESTFDAITNPVMIVSHDYIIQRANTSAASAANIDVRHLNGKTCFEALAGFTKPCKHCPLEQTQREGQAHQAELEPFNNGNRHYEVNAYPLEATEKGMAQSVLHYNDVTSHKKLQRQLMQSEKMAAVGTLAGGVAHEINNPLAGILAFAQLIIRQLDKNHPCQEDVKEIEHAALRCKQIVQNLLDFSRQNPDEDMVELQVNQVIEKILPLVKVQTRAGRFELVTDLKKLPTMLGSFHKLQQVFLNLITNAYQAMGQNGRVQITSVYDSVQNKIVITVVDDGPGIAGGHIDKIFDPFFTTKAPGEGTGLGLAISYGIVQEHGGNIEVKSAPMQGTKFTLTFPVKAGV